MSAEWPNPTEVDLREASASCGTSHKVMGLSGGNNTFELSGDVRDPTAVVLARIRKAQFAPSSASNLALTI